MKVRNKKLVYTIIGIVAVLLVTIGITYAYWLITKNQTGENVLSSACLDISLTDEENDITLTNQFPLSDEDGMKLTPYTFTVTNNCNTSVDYQIALETFEGADSINPSAIKVMIDSDTPILLNESEQLEIRIANATNSYLLKYGTLSAKDTEGSSATHTLRLWIDENASISEMKKTLTSKISVTIGQGITKPKETLASTIINHAKTNNYLYSTTPDFSKVTEDGEYGLYQAQDDYGTSYYFRGDVENNYVKLGMWKESDDFYIPNDSSLNYSYSTLEACESVMAGFGGLECLRGGGLEEEPMYWRIVRINGDGTIRLVYDGTSAVANGDKHTALIIETIYNNVSGNYDDIKRVGYTYDDGNGNQIDSIIKGLIDTWYTNNLEKDYGKYMSDSIFCNDREIASTNGDTTYFSAYDRLVANKSPILTCTNQSDRYTVDDTAKGNGLLIKPIGLMTADEVAMAGGLYNKNNSSYYLSSGATSDWTISPFNFDSAPNMFLVLHDDFRFYGVNYVSSDYYNHYGARPVINLKADVLFEGNGTIDSPYKIVMQ